MAASAAPPRRRHGDLADVGLHGTLYGLRHLVEEIGSLVQPAPLVAGAGKDLVESLPEAEGAITDRDLGRDGEAAAFHVDQQLAPALSAFPHADLEPDQFLLALGVAPISTNMHMWTAPSQQGPELR